MPRPTAVAKTGFEEDIRHLLIELRWGVRTVERYMEMRHGVRIEASQLRNYRRLQVERLKKQGKLPKDWEPPAPDDGSPDAVVGRALHPSDELPDVLSKRIALARLQEERIKLDARHEVAMGKQFNSQGKEIDLLNKLYSDIKTDMQDLGLWPTRAATPQVQINNSPMAAAVAGAQSSASAAPVPELPGIDDDVMKKMGRSLVLLRHTVEDGDEEEGNTG